MFQFTNIAREQRRGFLFIQQTNAAGHMRGGIGIAVAVAAHPRTETNRRGARGQASTGAGKRRGVQFARHPRHDMPKRMLHCDQIRFRFIQRRGAAAADFIRSPHFGDGALQFLFNLCMREAV